MASLMTIYRQVEREGGRWGLYPVMRDGKISVCEMVHEIPPRSSDVSVMPHKSPRVVASLDENSGMDAFSAILRHRISRHVHDFSALVFASRARARAEEQKRIDDQRAQFRAWLHRSRGRIISVGGMRR